ncbi:farnesyl pyrophosphate synthase 1-like isoform X1 [Chenopodium quinoa]|uniref:farnesyl pyrophosphate synthase 1-like isoform X1 n=1 Tax=Chenopodium quinoa TaxID=63459 RepID=UPI000B77670D|nr:farnesyl pyrophosphate synthase 1-like isoform X1 [Chenopodium quinoa]
MEGEKDERERFKQVYQLLKTELLKDPAFEYDHVSRQWLHQMLDYNVPGGKLNRGMSLIKTYELLNDGKQIPEDGRFRASVLGWCIQWLVGCVLVLDDILDNSHTRRGRPCWFRLPKVGMIAVNDGILLWNHINRILRTYFRDQPYYADLLDLFSEVEFQTTCGEMIDLLITLEGEKDLSKFTPAFQRRVSKYKTAYGTFYLPFACALLMLGEKLDDYNDVKDILLEMGIYFQVQDDYLDCFGDPEMIGKIGSDIEEFKCSWLVVKALEVCNEEQKKLLCENYGKADPVNVDAVKSLYKDINLQDIFSEYEIDIYEKLMASIEALPSKSVQAVLKSYLVAVLLVTGRRWLVLIDRSCPCIPIPEAA